MEQMGYYYRRYSEDMGYYYLRYYEDISRRKFINIFLNLLIFAKYYQISRPAAHKKTRKLVVCKVSFYFLKSSYSKSDAAIPSAYAE